MTGTIVTNASFRMYFTLNLPIRKLSAIIIQPHFFAASRKSFATPRRVAVSECTATAVIHPNGSGFIDIS